MSTVEIEARFRIDRADEALRHLAGKGIEFGEAIEQDDQAYAPTSWQYGHDRIGVPFARLRTQQGDHLFTVKTPITDVRTCNERETPVSDREAMHEAIIMMGFWPTVRIQKCRRTASLDDRVSLCVDSVAGVGDFLEIELIGNADDDLDGIREQLETFVNSLGLQTEQVTETYDTMVWRSYRDDSVTATAA